jgi:hypothetical protein
MQIETTIPLPTPKTRKDDSVIGILRRLRDSEPGSSVLFPKTIKPNTVWVAARKLGGKDVFTSRSSQIGVRVWRS